jgi:heat-inducible transcriptional repressor
MVNAPEQRKRLVFRAVVREYVETAEPVGSETILGKHHFGVSPATIRNDMADLEDEGYLAQPHTSAGRVPTEEGYRFYVDEFVREAAHSLAARQRQALEAYAEALAADAEARLRAFARELAHQAGETVVISFGGSQYATGMANLVRKPEFQDASALLAATEAFDDLDRIAADLLRRAQDGPSVRIGHDSPFGAPMSTVTIRISVPGRGDGVVGIVGPARMDYDANVALLDYVRRIFSAR